MKPTPTQEQDLLTIKIAQDIITHRHYDLLKSIVGETVTVARSHNGAVTGPLKEEHPGAFVCGRFTFNASSVIRLDLDSLCIMIGYGQL